MVDTGKKVKFEWISIYYIAYVELYPPIMIDVDEAVKPRTEQSFAPSPVEYGAAKTK